MSRRAFGVYGNGTGSRFPRLPGGARRIDLTVTPAEGGRKKEAGCGMQQDSLKVPDRVQVLIVGAGPTGLMLGVQLARRGVRVMVIDRNAGPSVKTKALGVQARTLEIYSKLGIADRALELGTRAVGATMWARGRRAARVPLGDAGQGLSPFPFLLILGQDDNERLLGAKLRELGVEVHWSTELVGIEQSADGVTATLRQADGATVRVEADRLAGCDGSRSAVRQLCGIDFPGAPYEHVFFVADTRASGPMVPGELNVYLWRGGFHPFFPMRGAGHWRAVGILPVPLRGRDDVGFDDVTPHIREQVGPDLRFTGCDWFSTYRIHHRCAARFRDRRCFLLGDAAHVHSPVGAQGMNTGLQDAYNLAWKLALVSSGRAAESLLDTYEAERVPVAERLLGTTDRAFSFLVSDGWLAGQLRTRVMPRILARAMSFERGRRFAFRVISQTGIRYPRSVLSPETVGAPDGAPRPGDRFPWMPGRVSSDGSEPDLFSRFDDTRFTLLLFGQDAPADAGGAHADLIRVIRAPDDRGDVPKSVRARIPSPSYYLLRPDEHVGLAGTIVDPRRVAGYLHDRVGLCGALRPDASMAPPGFEPGTKRL